MFEFTSSSIESISDVNDGKVDITFSGGRTYTYTVKDVEEFTSSLSKVINQNNSVGRFVNQMIRSQDLVSV